VLAGAAIVSLVVAMLFGVVPSWQAVSGDSCITRGHRTLGAPGARLRKALVVIETALAVTLLLSAGLLLKSFDALGRVDLGLDAENTLVATITPATTRYASPQALDRVVADIITRVEGIPGVRSAGIINDLPLSGVQSTGSLARTDRTYQPGEVPSAHYRTVTTDYFRTAGIPVVAGRGFDHTDRIDAPPSIVISAGAAQRLFAGEDPLGKNVRIMGFNRDIVGVVGDVRDEGPAAPSPLTAYVPYGQETQEWALRTTTLMVSVRDGVPADYFTTVRAAITAVDEATAINDVRTMEEVAASATRAERFRTTVMTVFAAVTLVLAAVGLAGVVAFQVAHRRRELGLRMALGATGKGVVSLVVRHGVRLSAVGALVGMGGAAILGRWFGHFLYTVTPLDPFVFFTVPVLFLVIAAAAALVPAGRAAGVDPAIALRED
jgi:predicted permease